MTFHHGMSRKSHFGYLEFRTLFGSNFAATFNVKPVFESKIHCPSYELLKMVPAVSVILKTTTKTTEHLKIDVRAIITYFCLQRETGLGDFRLISSWMVTYVDVLNVLKCNVP